MFSFLIEKPKEKNYVIASSLHGILLENGKPLANFKIKRKLTWNENESGEIEEYLTDNHGYFSLPLVEKSFVLSNLIEFVANQKIWVIKEDEDILIWLSSNRTGEQFGETAFKDIGLVSCDINDDYRRVFGEDQTLMATKCRWKGINLVESYE